jgi:hypothetical protein
MSLLVWMTTMALAGSENGNVNVGDRDRFVGAWRLAWQSSDARMRILRQPIDREIGKPE